MNLKTFNATNATKKGRVSEFYFRTYKGNGQCYFSPAALHLLGLGIGAMVAFHRDLDNGGQWYIEKVLKGGILVKRANPRELGFHSSKLIRTIYHSQKFTGSGGFCYIDPVPVEVENRKLYQLDLSELKND